VLRIAVKLKLMESKDMTFEDFLDMMSVFSDGAPKNVKVEYAFRIYGMFS
jgi:calcium and integrin-binding protein 1